MWVMWAVETSSGLEAALLTAGKAVSLGHSGFAYSRLQSPERSGKGCSCSDFPHSWGNLLPPSFSHHGFDIYLESRYNPEVPTFNYIVQAS